MKILISGGAGCLGSNIIEQLINVNKIIVIDNFKTGNKKSLPDHPNLTVIEGSVEDRELVFKIFEKFLPTHVIHSAASYNDPNSWIEDVNTNIIGTINFVDASQKFEVKSFINFQTALCYGFPKELPIPINHPSAPFTSYGISKTAAESYILSSKLPAISLRLANICAPRLSIGPIPTFYKRLKEGKDCFCSDSVRDFLDFSDFLSLLKVIMSSTDPQINGIFNVSTGEGFSIKDVFEVVSKYLKISPTDPPIVPVGDDDVKTVILDPSKTKKIFGWSPQVSFEETIVNQLKWYDKYGVDNIYSHLNIQNGNRNQ